MPALNEQAYEPAKVACEVQRTDQVFLIRFTGEVFPEYEYAFARDVIARALVQSVCQSDTNM